MGAEPTLEQWAGLIECSIGACPGCIVDRVVVLAETSSTQDAALRAFDGLNGVAVIAQKQTGGRGQRGNRWDDGDGDTLAISFAMRADGLDPLRLAAAGGLAAMDATHGACPERTALLVKWPNDVVARSADGDRKLAGVLIEIRDGTAIIGIGINTRARAWDGLGGVSIEELGGETDRVMLACALIGRLSRWMVADDREIRETWRSRDAMVGTQRVFVTNRERVDGEVVGVDPLGSIRVRTDTGERVLDARVTRNG
ncbi:MAG: biotin--[acetyl-CoA-carboxylase] ligase [Phycisphaerales bacterium]|nr:biotin--[acetyl-CoA-carboxylase] ligase [Phycisphaerales bacterium]